MLGLEIDGEFLDLLPGTRLELEKTNPFLQFDNDLVGDYSMPVEVRATPKNIRLTKYASLLQTRINQQGIRCTAWDHINQHSTGRLKIENPGINLNNANRGKISMYYLTGSAGFLQDIKEIRLRDCAMGGTRSFPWTGYQGTGFWGHIHGVANGAVNSYDYCFFPVINKAWSGDNEYGMQFSTDIINNVYWLNDHAEFQQRSSDNKELAVIVPFPYLHKVMQWAAAHVGWTVQGSILSDPDFMKIAMVNFKAIDWGYMSGKDLARDIILGPQPNPGTHPATVEFDLKDHMPDYTLSEFFIALKNRFGWWYDFDNKNKIITIQQLQNVVASSVKDLTANSSPAIEKKVGTKGKIYALKNDFLGEYANGQPTINTADFKGSLNTNADFPPASAAYYGHIYLNRSDNNFYVCRPDDSSDQNNEVYTWYIYAYNVYDVVPADATDDITTKATTLGLEYYNDYMDRVPRMDIQGDWNGLSRFTTAWGIHLVMHCGMQPNHNGTPIPFATSGIYNGQHQQVANWSLAFQCEKFDGAQVGLYDRCWKTVLDSVKDAETFEFTLFLDRMEYEQLKFSDTIIIAGVKMYLTKTRPVIPYTGALQVEALRI